MWKWQGAIFQEKIRGMDPLLDVEIVHWNTLLMNSHHPLLLKVRKLIEEKLAPYFLPTPPRRQQMEIQLEFHWGSKR